MAETGYAWRGGACEVTPAGAGAATGDAEVLLAIGARIRQARRSLGLLQREVGDLLRVTGVSVGNWERGKTSPTALNVVRLADALGVTVAWLLLGEAAA